MPRIYLNRRPQFYNQAVSSRNCDGIIETIQKLYDNYMDIMSLDEKKELLKIARIVLTSQQHLEKSERVAHSTVLRKLLDKCQTRQRCS